MKGTILSMLASSLLFSLVFAYSRTPMGPDINEQGNSCKEFVKYARFNPNSVLDDIWVMFYYWASIKNMRIYTFKSPSSRQKKVLQMYLNDTRVMHPVNWTLPMFIMKEKMLNIPDLIVQMGDKGQFLRYPIVRKIKKGKLIRPDYLIFKQFDNGKYLAFMSCENNEVYVLSKPKDVPKKRYMQDETAKLRFQGRNGKSYLYQGHEWMPVPEADDYDPERFYNMIAK